MSIASRAWAYRGNKGNKGSRGNRGNRVNTVSRVRERSFYHQTISSSTEFMITVLWRYSRVCVCIDRSI
jgi:hypothetical protein